MLKKALNKGTYFYIIKAICDKLIAHIIVNDEKLKSLLCDQGKDRNTHYDHFHSHSAGSPSHNSQTRKKK